MIAILAIGFLALAQPLPGQRFPFVIPGDDATPGVTDFSNLSARPAGEDGFTRVEKGHFFNDAGRLKLWGMNIGYGACFPSHDDADKVAAHLAKLGINAVRIHHHESQFSPTGLLNRDGTFDPEQVDRLDYFLAKLHEHGIYANLNLHVGREYSKELKLPSLGNSFDTVTDKFALTFQPELQKRFRAFCREYLTHVNPYRKLRRVDDPGIAMIEMCNESSFTRAGPSLLLSAPEPYASEIKRRWNEWLARDVASDRLLEVAWGITQPSQSAPCLLASSWSADDLGEWRATNFNLHSPLRVKIVSKDSSCSVRLIPGGPVDEDWHQQFTSPPFDLIDPSNVYTLTFKARSDQPRSIGVSVSMTRDGSWEPLGLLSSVKTDKAWRRYEFRFLSPHPVRNEARLAFSLGGGDVAVELAEVKLCPGLGGWHLPEGQSLATGTIGVPTEAWPPQSHQAFHRFMETLERDFYRDLKSFLTDELGVQVPVLTTQVDYQSLDISHAISDFQDMHVYWHHPMFSGHDWDPEHWTVQNETLLAFPFCNDWPRVHLGMRSGWRVHGQPFTITEWNTGEPNYYSVDAIPHAAVMASLQDWDGLFFFDYHNRADRWDIDRLQGYFEINGQPCKKALLGVMANLYRRGDLAPLPNSVAAGFGQHEQLGPLSLEAKVGIDPSAKRGTLAPEIQRRIEHVRSQRRLATPDQSVQWDATHKDRPVVLINTPKTKCVWGVVGGRDWGLDGWKFSVEKSERDYGVLAITTRDDRPLDTSGSILVVAVANAENQNVTWNEGRTSTGKDWGDGPTLVVGVPWRLTVPASAAVMRMFALDGRGNRIAPIQSTRGPNGEKVFKMGPSQKTVWYELTSEDSE